MKKFLTSGLILGLVISPAIAVDDVYTTDIAGSCTVDILGGTGEGNAANSFMAQYAPNKYTSAAGTYLLFSNGEINENQTCPTGSWCPGFTNQDFTDSTMGLNTCPTNYTSDSGASAQNQCYQTCSVSCTQPNAPAHSKNVTYGTETASGRTYYGSVCDAVTPTCSMNFDCITGYRLQETEGNNVFIDPNVVIDYKAFDFGQRCTTWYGGEENCGDEKFVGMKPGDFEVEFPYGTIKGEAVFGAGETYSCGQTVDINTKIEPGANGECTACLCKLTEFKDGNSGITQKLVNRYWVAVDTNIDFSPFYCDDEEFQCVDMCARSLTDEVMDSLPEIFENSAYIPASATCVANEITVSWDPNNGNDPTTNTCTYDGDITLPTAPEKTGYTFKGWKFNKNN